MIDDTINEERRLRAAVRTWCLPGATTSSGSWDRAICVRLRFAAGIWYNMRTFCKESNQGKSR